MSFNHDQNTINAHFEQNPLSEYALEVLKSTAVGNILSFDCNSEISLSDVFDFLKAADVGSDDFDDRFEALFGKRLTPLEDLEGESYERLAYLIFDDYQTSVDMVKSIIAQREISEVIKP